ncbi:MAG: lipid-A-disaccharide synthase [Myxococcales bacterium]|nr:lipid-A-disaccharide synthase [Myxococcales bacterium]
MTARAYRLFVSAGDVSGDTLCASLLERYRAAHGPLEVFGMGGAELRKVGVETLVGLEQLTVTGIIEVFGHLFTIIRAMRTLKRAVRERKPDLAILVDFPDFNLRLAKTLRRLEIPVLYFVSPQIWAWRFGRIRQIRRLVDHMLVLFPFEEPLYLEHGVPASYVGHPLVDRFAAFASANAIAPPMMPRVDQSFPIGILPGSRWSEVRRLLPVMLEALPALKELVPNARFVYVRAPNIAIERVQPLLDRASVELEVAESGTFAALADLQFALVASGTATLEVAIFGRPMVIGYRLSPFTYWLARLLIRVEHIGMVNLLAGERLVPELVQRWFNPRQIADAARTLLLDEERHRRVVEGLRRVAASLGEGGVIERQARLLERLLRRWVAEPPRQLGAGGEGSVDPDRPAGP